MSEVSSQKCELSLEQPVSALSEARRLLDVIAGPPAHGEKMKRVIDNAFVALGGRLSRYRIAEIFRGSERVSVSGDELLLLARAAARKKKEAERDEFYSRFERIEAALLEKDAEFYRPMLDAMRAALGGMGGGD